MRCESLPKLLQSKCRLPLPEAAGTQIIASGCEVWTQLKGYLVVLHRLVRTVGLVAYKPQKTVDLRILRIQSSRLAEFLLGSALG